MPPDVTKQQVRVSLAGGRIQCFTGEPSFLGAMLGLQWCRRSQQVPQPRFSIAVTAAQPGGTLPGLLLTRRTAGQLSAALCIPFQRERRTVWGDFPAALWLILSKTVCEQNQLTAEHLLLHIFNHRCERESSSASCQPLTTWHVYTRKLFKIYVYIRIYIRSLLLLQSQMFCQEMVSLHFDGACRCAAVSTPCVVHVQHWHLSVTFVFHLTALCEHRESLLTVPLDLP